MPVGRKVLLTLSGGPSHFSLNQPLVESVGFSESYPYDEATLRPVNPATATASGLGFHAGIDVGYYLTRNLGVGVGAMYAGANLPVKSHGESISLAAGGFHAGVGLRLRIAKPAPKRKTPVAPAPPQKKAPVPRGAK
jgi:hypothetical protein